MTLWMRTVRFATLLNCFVTLQWTCMWFIDYLETGPPVITTEMDDFQGCKPDAIDFRISLGRMARKLNGNIHGQPLAIDSVIHSIRKQFTSLSVGSPIIIELYGPSGTGKGYFCKLIAESMFTKGLKSELVHVLDGEEIYSLDEQLPLYKDDLNNWLVSNLTKCMRSMFIFKHTEKIPDQLFSAIHDAMHTKMGGIFMFTTTERSPIVSYIYAHLLKLGMKKRQMNTQQFGPALRKPLFYMGDRILFLPMEEIELKFCAWDELAKMGYIFPSECITENIYKRISVDKFGYTNITCKDVIDITKHVVLYENCQIEE